MTPAKKSTPATAAAAKKASRAGKATGAKKTSGATKVVGANKTAKATKPARAHKTVGKATPTRKAATGATAKRTAASRSGRGRTAAAKSPYSAKFVAQQEQALIEERATYFQQAETLRAEADAMVADYEPGDVQFDEESGEGDTISTERERDLQLSAQARQMVDEIDAALVKVKDGTYGICEASGQPIPRERLEAIPWARVRVEYKTGGLASRR